MTLKPFFTYYGGKYRVAPKYPTPLHETIIEPFCGSAGYSVRNNAKNVKLYDLNERVVGVWNYLIEVSEQEILSLPELFDDVRNLNVPQEAKWLIGYWCNKGSSEPRNKPSAWMRSRIRPNSYWGQSIKERIAFQLKDIRHWSCDLKDYLQIENKEATWFVDPPYCSESGRHYTYSNVNYVELSDWCKSLLGQAIVCEMDGAEWLPFSEFCTIKSLEGKRGKNKTKEVVWYGHNSKT